jgi:CRISPR-associated protein Cmr4
MLGATVPSWPTTVPDPQGDTISVVPSPRIAVSNGATPPIWKAVFQDYAFKAEPETSTQTIAEFIRDYCFPTASEYVTWKMDFPGRFAIVPDDVFRDFTRTATEVISRNRLDDNTRTVVEGALWIEEHLPAETVLYCPVLAADPLTNTLKRDKALQDAQGVLSFLRGRG